MVTVLFSSILALVAVALPSLSVHAPKATLRLEIANTEAQREHGLMDRHVLPAHTGMVFVFEKDQPVEFWMKNTLVPLDMVFVAANGTVRSIAVDVPTVALSTPDDRIPRRAGSAKYVIELPAGEAAKDGIVAGTRLTKLATLVAVTPGANE